MNPFFVTDFSISDSLKTVRKSVLIYETIIFTYALNQERYLRVFLEDGDVPIDNNASKRAIRGFCIGKKNWEMIDTINGATSSAIIYSIAETAKANNLKPYDYFECTPEFFALTLQRNRNAGQPNQYQLLCHEDSALSERTFF